ncbi:MAG TPA: outer membrane beta-barrel protein, partial [Vicinamibacteria bacterium]|nr:outer membrane beta-barrel protein [Vicinamibacteria bacterium]
MSRLALALALATPLTAAAADVPRAELFGGYSYLHSSDTSLHGFQAGVDFGLGHSFGLELAVNGHYGSTDDFDVSRTTLMAGPRYAWRGDSITPFLTLLGGVVRRSASIDVFEATISESETAAAGAAAAGLDVRLASRWALRLE